MDESPMFAGTPPEVLARRAASFGSEAAAYAEARPDYPDAAVRWALEPVRRGARVLDLGAGTGRLTESLLRALPGTAVTAVEPDPLMLAQLRARFPDVPAEPGSAEAIPLPDASLDAVLVGQAMHWFDLDRALPEIARVLRPGGVLAGLWNLDDDRVDWVREYKAKAGSTVSYRQWRLERLPVELQGVFGEVERATFPHRQRRTAESLTATVGTHSNALILPPAERAALLDDVLTFLRGNPETADGEFDLPIVTQVIRTRPA